MRHNKRGEGYVDVCITIVIFVALIVVALNIFHLIAVYTEVDRLAEDLVETAAYAGGFTDEFWERFRELEAEHGMFGYEETAERYFNAGLGQVQLGDTIWIIVSKETTVKGLGLFTFPVTVASRRSALSERYWK